MQRRSIEPLDCAEAAHVGRCRNVRPAQANDWVPTRTTLSVVSAAPLGGVLNGGARGLRRRDSANDRRHLVPQAVFDWVGPSPRSSCDGSLPSTVVIHTGAFANSPRGPVASGGGYVIGKRWR